MSRAPRDSQRQKVYDAERDAFAGGDWATVEGRRDVMTIDECQSVVNAVFESATLRERYGPTMPVDPPRVVVGHGNRGRGCYKKRPNEIHLPEWTRIRWYVLHECAHALTNDKPSHGQEFAKCYLDLLRAFLGRGRSEALEDEFKAKRVRFKPKRAYTISDEERQRRAERARSLAAMR